MNYGSNNFPSCDYRSNLSGRRGTCPPGAMSCPGMFPAPGGGAGFDPYATASSPSMRGGGTGSYGFQRQTATSRMRQQTRNNPRNACFQNSPATPSPQFQMQMNQMGRGNNNSVNRRSGGGGGAAQNPYGKYAPLPVTVNVSAAQLASAQNTPINPDRQECSVEGNPDVKYIPLNWQDILGTTGMDGMKVSMMPPGEPGQNQQLKVSFGGQQGTMQAGETPLKVMSFQPLSTGRIDKNSQNSAASIQREAMNYTVGGQLAQQQQQGRGGGAGSNNGVPNCSCPNCR